MKPVSPAAKDASLRILAVVLAIAIWAVAISDKQRASPAPKMELVVQAPVTLKNVSDDIIVTGLPEAVTIRLRGPKELESAALEATVAVVDLQDAEPGENLFPFEVVAPRGFEPVRMSSAVVDLILESRVVTSCPVKIGFMASTDFDLEVGQDVAGMLRFVLAQKANEDAHRIIGSPPMSDGMKAGQEESREEIGPDKAYQADSGLMLDAVSGSDQAQADQAKSESTAVDGGASLFSISVSPTEVSVEGADNAVSKVASVVALIEAGRESSVVVPVIALDVHGEPVPDVIVYPETVTVSIAHELNP